MSASAKAGAVSRALAKGGLRPIPSADHYRRDGLYVKRGWSDSAPVLVRASVTGGGHAANQRDEQALLEEAQRILAAAGYVAEAFSDQAALRVTKGSE